MRSSLRVAGLLAATTVLSFGCGSRTSLDFLDPAERTPGPGGDASVAPPPTRDGGIGAGHDAGAPGPDAEAPEPDAGAPGPDGAAFGSSDGGDASASLAPHCVPSSTCGSEYVPPGYGWAVGAFSIETISVVCRSPPAIVQQQIGGAWVTLAPFLGNASDTSNPTPDVYDLENTSGHPSRDPQTGAPVGSVQAIRACAIASAGTPECDSESFVTVTNCSTCPVESCGPGRFLDESCQCVADFCPCPRDPWPACPTPVWRCW